MSVSSPTSGSPTPAQSSQEAHASAVEMLSNDEYSKYMLQNKNEMLPVLRGLTNSVSQVTMFFNEGRDMVLTSLVSYDNDHIVLDYGPSSDMNRKALDADKLFCVTQLDKVRIQFTLRGLSTIQSDGRPAFRAALPETMLRLQRREFFRLTLPISRPLKISLTVLIEGKATNLDASVTDISGGGFGLSGLPKDLAIDKGVEIANLKMDLPEVGMITGKAAVRSVMLVTNRSGVQSKRAGCEFVALPGPMLNLVQRYIIKCERERKARESGMN